MSSFEKKTTTCNASKSKFLESYSQFLAIKPIQIA
jgi:hypothetical protein